MAWYLWVLIGLAFCIIGTFLISRFLRFADRPHNLLLDEREVDE